MMHIPIYIRKQSAQSLIGKNRNNLEQSKIEMRNYALMLAAITMLLACNPETRLINQCEKQLNSMYKALDNGDGEAFFIAESKYYKWANNLSAEEQEKIAEIESSGLLAGYFEGMQMSGEPDVNIVNLVCELAPNETSAAIQKLKDISELQLAYKNVYGYYADNFDILRNFYNNGFIINPNTQERIPTKKKLFKGRRDFGISSIEFLSTDNMCKIEMRAYTKNIWGVQVPLFEAYIPWHSLLVDYDNEIVESIVRVMDKTGCTYPGLIIGHKNNILEGNWE